jgi:hypothetical protein
VCIPNEDDRADYRRRERELTKTAASVLTNVTPLSIATGGGE